MQEHGFVHAYSFLSHFYSKVNLKRKYKSFWLSCMLLWKFYKLLINKRMSDYGNSGRCGKLFSSVLLHCYEIFIKTASRQGFLLYIRTYIMLDSRKRLCLVPLLLATRVIMCVSWNHFIEYSDSRNYWAVRVGWTDDLNVLYSRSSKSFSLSCILCWCTYALLILNFVVSLWRSGPFHTGICLVTCLRLNDMGLNKGVWNELSSVYHTKNVTDILAVTVSSVFGCLHGMFLTRCPLVNAMEWVHARGFPHRW